jgi:hypothetical protein
MRLSLARFLTRYGLEVINRMEFGDRVVFLPSPYSRSEWRGRGKNAPSPRSAGNNSQEISARIKP